MSTVTEEAWRRREEVTVVSAWFETRLWAVCICVHMSFLGSREVLKLAHGHGQPSSFVLQDIDRLAVKRDQNR
jgi:hypothetical protein